MWALWKHSLLVRTASVGIAIFAILGILTVAYTAVATHERAHQASTTRLNQLLDTVESTVRIACYVGDQALADEVAEGLLKNTDVLTVSITAGKKTLTHKQRQDAAPAETARSGALMARDIHSPFNAEEIVGRILIAPNDAKIEQDILDEVRLAAIQLGWQFALATLFVIGAMLLFIVRPIKSLSDYLHHMDANSGDRLPIPDGHAHTEIGRLVEDVNLLAGHLVSTIEEEKRLRLRLEMDEKKYHAIFQNAETGIFILGKDAALNSWNPAFAQLLQLPAMADDSDTLHMTDLAWETPVRLEDLISRGLQTNTALSDNLAFRSQDGPRRWLHIVLSPIGDDLLQGVVHDVTEHMEAEASARHIAITDPLTGVANRLGLEERLQILLRNELVSQTGGFALILIDLDNFKRINEGHGLPAGDEILKTVTARLSAGIKDSDIVARLSSDLFAIVLQNICHGEDVERVAGRLGQSLRQNYFLAGSPVHLHASMGITFCPMDGSDIPTLLRNAELALGRVKAQGGDSFVFFSPALSEAAEHRRHLENDLRYALKNEEFVLYYQPIIDLRANRVAGAEALIRWRHPDRGLVPPDAFIPLAEETGLINDIGLWALDTACAQLARWQEAGISRYLSINVSGRQVPGGLPPATLMATLQRHGIDPSQLALEITEGVLLSDTGKAMDWLGAVCALGFHVYLDDFGTGYSSLSYLKHFPVDTLKVDKSFVRDMSKNNSDRTLVEAIVAMAGSLGLEVVAEGVEKQEQISILRRMDCHYAQGYFFSRPIPAEEFDAMSLQVEALLSTQE